MNGIAHSAAKLILRLVAWVLVACLGVSAEVGEFIANDPDVVFLTSIGAGIIGVEVAFGGKKLIDWWRSMPQPDQSLTEDRNDVPDAPSER